MSQRFISCDHRRQVAGTRGHQRVVHELRGEEPGLVANAVVRLGIPGEATADRRDEPELERFDDGRDQDNADGDCSDGAKRTLGRHRVTITTRAFGPVVRSVSRVAHGGEACMLPEHSELTNVVAVVLYQEGQHTKERGIGHREPGIDGCVQLNRRD